MPHNAKHITDERFRELTQAPFARVRELADMRRRVLEMTDGLTDEESLAVADLEASVTRAVLVAEAAAFKTPTHPDISREVVEQANTMLTTGSRMRALAGQAIAEEGQQGRQSGFRAAAARAVQILIDVLSDYEGGQPVNVSREADRVLAAIKPHGTDRGGNPTNGGQGNQP